MATPSQLVGQTLSHYRILEQIGAGGMGVVYRAHDERLERNVAIKVLPVGTLADGSARRRFRKEALTLSKLSHPNIATVHDFDSQDGIDFLVTEYISGVTLDARLAGGALPEKEVIRLGTQLSEGLNAAHQHDIVHRDLKPANLRLTPDGRLKILDFGLAQLMPHASDLGLTATLTQSQEVTGTLPYMAPEQLRAGVADARSDIWAAGAVLYEMATAHPPFEEKLPSALAADIIDKTPLAPRRVRSELSPKLEAIILKCLEKEPAKRYSSARELHSDLDRLSTGVTPLAARRRLWPMVAASATVVVMLAVGAFFYLHRVPKLTEKDTIVLADFDNKTGDAVFDDTLKEVLAVKLGESPFLNIVPDDRVQEVLREMARSPHERLTGPFAREVCQRLAEKAMLAGSIAPLGNHYVINLKASNCQTGDSLAREQVEAQSKEQVLKALDKAATKLRGKLGESLSTVAKFDTPIDEATTASLEALKAWTLGEQQRQKSEADSIPFFEHAIELDPNFATAYAELGAVYGNLGAPDRAAEYIRKAVELRQRVSEQERFYISTHYYTDVTEEVDKAIATFELWEQTYPRDSVPHSNLSVLFNMIGQPAKAAEETREAMRLQPDAIYLKPNVSLGFSHLYLNRLDEAEAIFEKALAQKNYPGFHIGLYCTAFLRGDAAGMQREAASMVGNPEETTMILLEAQTAAFSGQLEKARERFRDAVDLARRKNFKEIAASTKGVEALTESEFGNTGRARNDALAASAIFRGKYALVYAALALINSGDDTHAQPLLTELGKRFPTDTLLNAVWLPAARASIEVRRGNPGKAIELLRTASPYEFGAVPPSTRYPYLYPIYVRGEAYLRARQAKEAAAEFQKILDHQGIAPISPLRPLARLGLARAYILSGDTAQSRSAYQDLFNLWKDADSNIPILREAKAEYARLQ